MTKLPNPFEFNSAVAPATAAESVAGPDVADPPVPAIELFPESVEPDRLTATSAGAEFPSAPAAFCSEACSSRDESLLPSREVPPDLSGVSVQERPLADFTHDILESFSDYAARESKHIISPPLNAERIGYNAVRAALNIHPRDLDEDPPPLFLRKPRPAFLRALFELGDAR